MLTLRPYQVDLIERVSAAYRAQHRAVVMQVATGGGKTATASVLIDRAVRRGHQVVFGAMLDCLLDDTATRLRASGIRCGIIQADRREGRDLEAPVQVVSLQTLAARPGLRPPARLVILDECQHATCATVRGILEAYPSAWLLGLTATPQRGDGAPLGDVFDAMVCGPTLAELTAAGWLVPATVHAPVAPIEGALGMAPLSAYERWCRGRPTLVFAQHSAHAHEIATELTAAGYPAATVLADTDLAARRAARAGLGDGTLAAAVTVRALLEGWDQPAVSAVMLAQAFSTVAGYLQAIGRGLRSAPGTGKRDCCVVDLRGAVYQHGLPIDPRTWSLTGEAVSVPEALPSLRRCRDCHACFPVASRCPLCGSASLADPRPVRIQRAEFFEASGMPPSVRVQRWLDGAVRAITRSGKVDEITARRIALRKPPSWVREALAMPSDAAPEPRRAAGGGW